MVRTYTLHTYLCRTTVQYKIDLNFIYKKAILPKVVRSTTRTGTTLLVVSTCTFSAPTSRLPELQFATNMWLKNG